MYMVDGRRKAFSVFMPENGFPEHYGTSPGSFIERPVKGTGQRRGRINGGASFASVDGDASAPRTVGEFPVRENQRRAPAGCGTAYKM
jgi:hypothetical protein